MDRPDPLESGDDGLAAQSQGWLQALPVTAYITDDAWWLGKLRFVADSIVDVSGRPAADYRANPELWLTAIPEPFRRPVLERLQAALGNGESRTTLSYRIEKADGTQCNIDDTLTIERDEAGRVVALVGLLQEREAYREETHDDAQRALLTYSGDLLLQLDEDLNCLQVAGAVQANLGIDAEQLHSRSLFGLMAPEDGPKIQRALDEHAFESAAVLLELRLRHRDEGYRWFEIHFSPCLSSDDSDASRPGATPGWVAIARDITERRRQTLQWDAYTATDELTSALNRDAFMGLLRQALAMGEANGRFTLIMFDVDHFAEINRAWGREGGDLVLACIGEMCRATLRERFSFGRLDDDGFALLLSGKSLQETAAVAERMRSRFAATRVEFHGHWLSFSVSLGVAERRSGESADAFLERAKVGLRSAKQHGRNRVQQAP